MSLHDVHFLQSEDWQALQNALGKKTFRRSGDRWSYLAIVERSGGLTRLYCPYGPSVATASALSPALDSLQQLAHEQGAHYVRLQPAVPYQDAVALGLRPVAYSQPSDTSVIDLNMPLDDIYARMKQNTRNICKNYTKKGLSYSSTTISREMSDLLRLLKGVARHNHITVHDDNYLRLQAETLMPRGAARLHHISYHGEVIAAALTYHTESTHYYAHAAADHNYRKLGASTALVGEIIHSAQQAGAKKLDLYGITTSDDRRHPWAGFTRFKQSFGGQTVHLGQTMELPIKPVPYWAYRAARAVRSKLP